MIFLRRQLVLVGNDQESYQVEHRVTSQNYCLYGSTFARSTQCVGCFPYSGLSKWFKRFIRTYQMCNVHRPNFVFSWQQERTMAHLATYSLTFHPSYERYCFVSKVKKYQSSITEDQKRKVICFCECRLIPALVMETLLKSFHLEGWPRYFQFEPLTSVWFCFASLLFVYRGLSTLTCMPLFFVKPKKYFSLQNGFQGFTFMLSGLLFVPLLGRFLQMGWRMKMLQLTICLVECQVKLFQKEQQH